MSDVSTLPRLASQALTPCWDNLNKLTWVDGFAFTSYGVTLGVRVSDPALLPMLRARLPRDAEPSDAEIVERYFSMILGGSKPGSRIRAFNMLYLDHSQAARSHRLNDVLDAFESWTRLSVAEFAPTRVFVHAGAVGWRGRAILIPGKTQSGKSSLVAELVKAGATYYSDEFAVLDENGRVHPFAKPLSMRASPTARQHDVAVEDIGGRAGEEPLPVGLVVMSQYKAGALWRPQTLSQGVGLLELLANTVSARRAAERALATLEGVVSNAPVIKSERGEAKIAAARILQVMEAGA